VLVSRDSMIGVAFAQILESTFTRGAKAQRNTERTKEAGKKKLG